MLVFPGMSLATAFLLSTMLCATDAALGQRVVDDPAVPSRVRQALDVESGLNDGLAVPFFLVAAEISAATRKNGTARPSLSPLSTSSACRTREGTAGSWTAGRRWPATCRGTRAS